MTTPLPPPPTDRPGQFTPNLIWDPATETQEMLDLWSGAWSIWGDYLGRLAIAAGPMEMVAAGEQLVADSLQICGRITSARLRAGGVSAPLLNDA